MKLLWMRPWRLEHDQAQRLDRERWRVANKPLSPGRHRVKETAQGLTEDPRRCADVHSLFGGLGGFEYRAGEGR